MAVLVGMGAAAAGCSSGSAPKSVASKSGGAGATATVPPAPGAASGTPAATGGAAATTPPVTATPVGASAGHTTTPASGAAKGTTATSSAPAGPTGPAPVPAGTYSYTLVSGGGSLTTGTTTTPFAAPTTSTLTVSSPVGGAETWTWQASGQTTVSSALTFNSAGVFLTAETVPYLGTCQFGQAVASPPWPLAVGKTFSGQASCSGQTVTLSGSIKAQSGGNFIVQSVLTVAGQALITEGDVYSPARRLPVQTTLVVNGSLGSARITTNATYRLVS
jgi:hypothetical protein